MASYSQGEAVFQAVCATIGTPESAVKLTDHEKEEVYERVFTAFKTGACAHSSNPTDEQLKKYIPGLVNNWVRKDPRLNGGKKYEVKNPGSRSGAGDEMVKEMKKLLAVTIDPKAKQQIQAAIDERLQALKPKVELDISKLPESIRHLYPQS